VGRNRKRPPKNPKQLAAWGKGLHAFNGVPWREIMGDEFFDELIRQAYRDGEIKQSKKILALNSLTG
jgi:hypothetical protein